MTLENFYNNNEEVDVTEDSVIAKQEKEVPKNASQGSIKKKNYPELDTSDYRGKPNHPDSTRWF